MPTNTPKTDRSTCATDFQVGLAVVNPTKNALNTHKRTERHGYDCDVVVPPSCRFDCSAIDNSSCCELTGNLGSGGRISCFVRAGKLRSRSRHSGHWPDSIATSHDLSASVKLNLQISHLNVRTNPQMILLDKSTRCYGFLSGTVLMGPITRFFRSK